MRSSKNTSQAFLEYQEFIVGHPSFEGLPNVRNSKGEITWVRQGDQERARWWDSLKREMGLPDRASVARRIHPAELKGLKPCQLCGKSLSIHNIYPNTIALRKIKSTFDFPDFVHFRDDIYDISNSIFSNHGSGGLKRLAGIFNVEDIAGDSSATAELIVQAGKFLSPGVMSNAPDRLDGFHSYNACCRSTEDTGRHKSNLARYSSDRRAYENWADGDWRGADRLMGLYKSETKRVPCPRCNRTRKMTPDHIGPLSLGFKHTMIFQPLCKECNSTKNNRLSLADFQELLSLEKNGADLVSWHSQEIWRALTPLVVDEKTAARASVLMRRNLHHVLLLLSDLHSKGFTFFIAQYLNPDYAHFDFEFRNFDPASGSFEFRKYPVRSKNTEKLAERYLRISFESLVEYGEVEKRNTTVWRNERADLIHKELVYHITKDNVSEAKSLLGEFLKELAQQAIQEF